MRSGRRPALRITRSRRGSIRLAWEYGGERLSVRSVWSMAEISTRGRKIREARCTCRSVFHFEFFRIRAIIFFGFLDICSDLKRLLSPMSKVPEQFVGVTA